CARSARPAISCGAAAPTIPRWRGSPEATGPWRGSAWRWRSPVPSLSLSSSSEPSSPVCSDAARPALTDRPRALLGTALLQVGADVRELARRTLAEEGDGDDADDGDERNEQRVLDEAGAPLIPPELCPQ